MLEVKEGSGRLVWECGVMLLCESDPLQTPPVLGGQTASCSMNSSPGASPVHSPPCTVGVTKTLSAHRKCLRSLLMAGRAWECQEEE